MYVLNNCKYVIILNKIFFESSSSKDIKALFIKYKDLCYSIPSNTTGNPVNSYLTTTADKTHHGPVIALFSVQLLQFL